MSEENSPPPSSGWRALIGFIQQWQVLLALAVGLSGLWFNYNEQRRKELDVNREAVKAAHDPAMVKAFLDDPRNTLIEFQATYPPGAFCAALGFFVAENGRASRRGEGGRTTQAAQDGNTALRAQVEALAAEAWVGEARFESFAKKAEAMAGKTSSEANCPRVKLDAFGAGWLLGSECLLAIDTFGQNLCEEQRRLNDLKTEIETAAMTKAAVPYSIPPDIPALPGAGKPVIATVPPLADDEPAPAAGIPGPGPECGGASPLIFPQFTDGADESRINALRDQMLAAGWTLAKAELVPKGTTAGDLRIYSENQRDCAEYIAGLVGALPEVKRPIRVISLAARYKSPPGNQMELWLPALGPALTPG